MLLAAHHAGQLQFFGDHVRLADKAAFLACLAPLRNIDWVVYAKGHSPDPGKCYAICRATPTACHLQSPAQSADQNGVTFKYKDYRIDARRPATSLKHLAYLRF